VALSGSYRLTTAFLVGHSFRSAVGFELEIPTRDGPWATDERPKAPATGWTVVHPSELDGDTLVVSVGVLHRPANELKAAGLSSVRVLDIFKDAPIAGALDAQAGAALVKAAVLDAVARLGARRVRLHLAGPAAFAVAIGHRWNPIPPTDLFEFDSATRTYVMTARCG
jgi:hypothetical protein